MVLGAVQHVGGVDELVTRASDPQLRLRVAQNGFTPENPTSESHTRRREGGADSGGALLGVAGRGREVQLVLGPEDHVPGPDLQDGGGLERRGDGEQGELRRAAPLAAALGQELQTPLNVQGLRGNRSLIKASNGFCSLAGKRLSFPGRPDQSRTGMLISDSTLAGRPQQSQCLGRFHAGSAWDLVKTQFGFALVGQLRDDVIDDITEQRPAAVAAASPKRQRLFVSMLVEAEGTVRILNSLTPPRPSLALASRPGGGGGLRAAAVMSGISP